MTHKLTIHIGVEPVSEDLDAKMDTYLQKPPFDKRKISAAVLVVIGVVYGIGSLFFPAQVVVAGEAPAASEAPAVSNAKAPVASKAPVQPVLVASKPEPEPELKLEATPEPGPEPVSAPVKSTSAVVRQKGVVEAVAKKPVTELKSQTRDSLLRAVLTTAVVENEPIDDLGHDLDTNGELTRRVYFFTELKQLNGQKIYHRWLYKGKQVAELILPVRSDRWRTYSSKAMPKQWVGDWAVEVLDSERNLLGRYAFSYRLGL